MTRISIAVLIIAALAGCIIISGDGDDWGHGERYGHHFDNHGGGGSGWGGRR